MYAIRSYYGVVRHGYLVFTWGDASRRGDVASACKPWYSHFLFKAVDKWVFPGTQGGPLEHVIAAKVV